MASELVRHLSTLCPPYVVGLGRACSSCPPCVRIMSAMSLLCVRLVSALCCRFIWPRLLLLSASYPLCVRLVSTLCCRLWRPLPFLSALCPPCVCHESALRPLCAVLFTFCLPSAEPNFNHLNTVWGLCWYTSFRLGFCVFWWCLVF